MKTRRNPFHTLLHKGLRHPQGHPNMTIRGLPYYCFILLSVGMTFWSCSNATKIADEVARGTDEITAKVNGIPYTFEVKGATNYFGIHTSGVSGVNTIGLHLGHGFAGKTMWTGNHTLMDSSPAASWNGVYAIKDVGYLDVKQNELNFISGTFEFTTIDPATKDTIRVTNGTFGVHYITTD